MIEVKQAPPKKIVQNNANLFEKLRIPPLVEYTAELGFLLPNKNLRLFVQDHHKNPGGTIKDWRARRILDQIGFNLKINRLVIVTAGNAGYSARMFFPEKEVVCVVDEKTNGKITKKLEKVHAKVLKLDLSTKLHSKEEIVKFVAKKLGDENKKAMEISSGFHDAYKPLLKSITREIRWFKRKEIPKQTAIHVVFPIGSGEVATGFISSLDDENMRLVAVSPSENPSIADKLNGKNRLYENYLSYYFQFKGSPLQWLRIGENEIFNACWEVNALKTLKSEESAAIAFAALPKIEAKEGDTIVVVNTGWGIRA